MILEHHVVHATLSGVITALGQTRLAVGPFVAGGVAAFVGAALLTPLTRDLARAAGLVDASDGARKTHPEPVPRIGGVAVFFGLLLGVLAIDVGFGGGAVLFTRPMLVVGAGGAAMFALGIVDDLWSMSARYKLVGQVLIATAVYAAGLRVTELSLPFAGVLELPTAIGFVFTAAWIVGITNAFNLIDGMDGLAAGAAIFALVTMCAVAIVNGQTGTAWLTIALAGAALGFLLYNFHPATIFLGDSGSLFLGYMLGATGLMSSQKSPTAVAVAVPIIALGLPVMDTLIAVVRRFLRGQPIFAADRGHIHHRLLNVGNSPRRVALMLYAACAFLAISGVALLTLPEFQVVVLIVIGLGIGLGIQQLRILEFEELARSVVRGVRQRRTIGRSVRAQEAAARIAIFDNLDAVFATLGDAFRDVGAVEGRVSLERWFLEHGPALHVASERSSGEVVVWSLPQAGESSPTDWELRFPLLIGGDQRIGTLVVVQRDPARVVLGNVPLLSSYLRTSLQRQLERLWREVPSLTVEAVARRTGEWPRWGGEEGIRRAKRLATHESAAAEPRQ